MALSGLFPYYDELDATRPRPLPIFDSNNAKRSAPWDVPGQENPYKKARSSPSKVVSPISRFEAIGDGTFGKVWSAREIATNKMVALKQIKMNGQEGFPRTAIREIQIMKKVCHSNILSIQEVVWADDGDCVDAYLVMDLFNFDLRKLLDKIGIRFSTAEIKHLFNQIVKGVAYLHQNSLLHRDLKTENILVDLHGNLKICDFGLSRQFTTKNAYTPVVVTLWYRPPELLLGPVEYSTEIDQWSVGCIFAELLRGVVLFNGNNEVEQVDKIFQVTGTPSEDTWPGFSSLPQHKTARIKSYPNRLLSYFEKCCISSNGFDLLSKLLALCPSRRISAEYVLQHNYFKEEPAAVTCIDMFAKSDYIRYQYCQEQASQHPAYNKHQQQHHNSHMQSHQPPPPSYTQYPQQSHYLQRQQQLIHHARQKQQQYPLHHQQLSFPTYSFLKNPPAIECHGGTYPVPSPHPHPPQPNQLQLHPDNRT